MNLQADQCFEGCVDVFASVAKAMSIHLPVCAQLCVGDVIGSAQTNPAAPLPFILHCPQCLRVHAVFFSFLSFTSPCFKHIEVCLG